MVRRLDDPHRDGRLGTEGGGPLELGDEAAEHLADAFAMSAARSGDRSVDRDVDQDGVERARRADLLGEVDRRLRQPELADDLAR